MLISHGADVTAKNDDGETPLDLAIRDGYKELVELLRKHGAKE
ncbi:MAG: ankyrin repeat domain-containing protein [Planctomycetota bacterium]